MKIKAVGGALLAMWLSASSVEARAQQVIPAGRLVLDGFSLSCRHAPTYIMGNELGDVAKGNAQAIYLNWQALRTMPTAVKAFVYAHECGHVLGMGENAADDFAIRLGRQQGWINPPVLRAICQSVYFSPGDWSHLPGPVRCQRMLQAFGS